jgi:hypothetical protein
MNEKELYIILIAIFALLKNEIKLLFTSIYNTIHSERYKKIGFKLSELDEIMIYEYIAKNNIFCKIYIVHRSLFNNIQLCSTIFSTENGKEVDRKIIDVIKENRGYNIKVLKTSNKNSFIFVTDCKNDDCIKFIEDILTKY